VKATEGVKSLEAQRRGTPRRIGAWNVRKVKAGTGEALPGPGVCGSGAAGAYNRQPGSRIEPGGRRRGS
jgi:hypothetical protein